MRAIRFLPLAFLAGADGMALFLPYLLIVLVSVYLARHYRSRQIVRRDRSQVSIWKRLAARVRLPGPSAVAVPHA